MKKLIPVILLFSSFFCNAQKIHFTDTTNRWSVCVEKFNDFNPIFEFYSYGWINDTTIGGYQYRKFDFDPLWYTPGTALVREDTMLNKVFVRDTLGDSDIVLMNYNLATGDTFIAGYFDGGAQPYYLKYFVQSVDSVLINATWHKVWHFSNLVGAPDTKNTSAIIEGIGNVRHPAYLLQRGGVEPPHESMYCFSNQSVEPHVAPAVLHFDNQGSCSYYPHLKTQAIGHTQDELRIAPNPATDRLEVAWSIRIDDLVITDATGQIILKAKPGTTHTTVNIGNLAAGLYILKTNGMVVKKFIKL